MTEYRPSRVLVGRFPTGADLLKSVQDLLQREEVCAGQISIIGALRKSNLGWYDDAQGQYHTFEEERLAELLHCTGNVSLLDGAPFPHLHAVLSIHDQSTFGGHVFEGCEVYVAEYQVTVYEGVPLERVPDEATGLKLWPAD